VGALRHALVPGPGAGGDSDLIFAVDSIPAIFAITTDPFIVLTSNIFAILGLRAMYFLLADFAGRFSLLKYGLAAVLMFIGGKMLLIDVVKIPVGISLGVVALLITTRCAVPAQGPPAVLDPAGLTLDGARPRGACCRAPMFRDCLLSC
jgi:tellurite resistance protein TerC